MTERWELAELIGQTLEDHNIEASNKTVEAVLDAIEPLIRAEEYGKCAARLDDMDYFMVNTRAKTLADLRAKVEALPDSIGRTGSAASSLIWRGAVLALFDGSDNGSRI